VTARPFQVLAAAERTRRDFRLLPGMPSHVEAECQDMDPRISALERAFQLARSGQVANIEEIKLKLKREGYQVDARDYGGQSLRSQLRELIKAARLAAESRKR